VQFDGHAEHDYARFVAEHPEFETLPHHSAYADTYGAHATPGAPGSPVRPSAMLIPRVAVFPSPSRGLPEGRPEQRISK
jgi:hypothetical protein